MTRIAIFVALALTLAACGGGNEAPTASPAPVPCGQSAECTARVQKGDHIATCVESVVYGFVWSSWDNAVPVRGTCAQTVG